VIYYFFDSKHRKSLSASTFLRCILHQAVSLKRPSTTFCHSLEPLFANGPSSEPAIEDLTRLFRGLFGKDKKLVLLLDGLDEANENEQRIVKSFLKMIQGLNDSRIIATSHVDMDLSKVFVNPFIFQIQPENVKPDIEMYIQSQIDIHAQDELSSCSKPVLEVIKRTMVSDAEGM
jgi:hypothetical protein